MDRISREELLAVLEAGTVRPAEAPPAGAFAATGVGRPA